MKARELRIGNLLNYNGNHKEIGIISEILKNDLTKVSPYKIGINHRIDIYYDIDKLKPIPLTKEWFAKLGMTYYSLPTKSNRSVGYYTLKYGNRFKINSSNSNYSFINFRKEIKYVHELQNLYFAITGNELKTV